MPFTGLRFKDTIIPNENGNDILTPLINDVSGGDYYIVDASGIINYSNWGSDNEVEAGDIIIYTDTSGSRFVKVKFTLPLGYVKTQHLYE